MRIKETKVYPFAELSDDAKETAIQSMADINVNYEWWDCIHEDAANVDIKLTEFDIDRGSYCCGHFTENAEDVAESILKEHGESCETYNTAKAFLDEYQEGKAGFETDLDALYPDETPSYEEFEDTGAYDDIMNEFKRSILEDYRIMLQKQFEYLTSEEAIIETIEVNEYEFTADGKLY